MPLQSEVSSDCYILLTEVSYLHKTNKKEADDYGNSVVEKFLSFD